MFCFILPCKLEFGSGNDITSNVSMLRLWLKKTSRSCSFISATMHHLRKRSRTEEVVPLLSCNTNWNTKVYFDVLCQHLMQFYINGGWGSHIGFSGPNWLETSGGNWNFQLVWTRPATNGSENNTNQHEYTGAAVESHPKGRYFQHQLRGLMIKPEEAKMSQKLFNRKIFNVSTSQWFIQSKRQRASISAYQSIYSYIYIYLYIYIYIYMMCVASICSNLMAACVFLYQSPVPAYIHYITFIYC